MSGKAALYRIVPSKQGHFDKKKILSAAEDLEVQTKGKGQRNGALGAVGLSILRALLRLGRSERALPRQLCRSPA